MFLRWQDAWPQIESKKTQKSEKEKEVLPQSHPEINIGENKIKTTL